MTLISILGAIGIVVGLTRALPQFITLLRAREAYGVSVDTAATSSIVSLGWTVYGLLTDQPYIALASGSTSLIFALVTIFALRYGRSLREFKVAPLWFGVLFLAFIIFTRTGLSFVMPISSLASNLPQIWVAYKERNLADLSLGTWSLSLTEGLVWGIYSLLGRDYSVMVSAVFQMLTTGTIVALKVGHDHSTQP
jgi:uncharacterized protein with PQ loop repeat